LLPQYCLSLNGLRQIPSGVKVWTPIHSYAASETKASVDQARSLIEQAEALGEPLEDPLLLFSVLYGFWIANFVAFNGDAMRELAMQFLALAEQQGTTAPLMMGHRCEYSRRSPAKRTRRVRPPVGRTFVTIGMSPIISFPSGIHSIRHHGSLR
jgi:hypothetical protein